MNVITPPQHISKSFGNKPTLFLGGSIENGAAANWQELVVNNLNLWRPSTDGPVVFNPRRADWDSSMVTCKSNPKFKEQVDWEITALFKSSIVSFYFDPETKAPITLYEFGLACGSRVSFEQPIIVYCPNNYWKKGNVDIYAERYNVLHTDSFDEYLYEIKRNIQLQEEKYS